MPGTDVGYAATRTRARLTGLGTEAAGAYSVVSRERVGRGGGRRGGRGEGGGRREEDGGRACLLYTSDAADDM
eukprot:54038-Rhodomonas_salina.3